MKVGAWIGVIAVMMFTAACGGQPGPTATPLPPPTINAAALTPAPAGDINSDPNIEVTRMPQEFLLAQTLFPGATVVLQIPGTLTYAETTPDPLPPPQFVSLRFIRGGGITGQELVVELLADGTLTRNGVAGVIAPETVSALWTTLLDLRIFDIQGNFTGLPQRQDAYVFALTVTTDRGSTSLQAMEEYTPIALLTLFNLLGQLGL